MTILKAIWAWLIFLFIRHRLYRAESVEDVPEEPQKRRVYLVGDPDMPWSAAMLCPCGCGELIQLSLIPRDKPSWRASRNEKGFATLHPSVWRTAGCKSHFFVREGRVVWAR